MRTMSQRFFSYLALALVMAGCAFDLSHVKQIPVVFTLGHGSKPFELVQSVKCKLGTGFPTVLQARTVWHQKGTTEFGDVFSTKDQIVKVEASNIYETYIVISNSSLVGFYLPGQKTFVRARVPVPLQRVEIP